MINEPLLTSVCAACHAPCAIYADAHVPGIRTPTVAPEIRWDDIFFGVDQEGGLSFCPYCGHLMVQYTRGDGTIGLRDLTKAEVTRATQIGFDQVARKMGHMIAITHGMLEGGYPRSQSELNALARNIWTREKGDQP